MTKKHTPKSEPSEGNLQPPHILDLSQFPAGVEVIIRKTNGQVEQVAGGEMQSSPSYAESAGENQEHLAVPQKATDVSEPKTETPKTPRGDKETIRDMSTYVGRKWKDMDTMKYGGPLKAGLVGGSAAALPALYYGSGLSALSLTAAATTLGAVALPAVGLWAAAKEGKGTAGLLGGSAAGFGLYQLGGGTLHTLSTALGSVALPLGLSYAGYTIGKKHNKPVLGALAGATTGILAAPAATGALTAASGGGWAALGSAAASIGSTAGIAAGVGLGAAGLYGLGYVNQKIGTATFKPKSVTGIMAESILLPVSALWKGGELAINAIKKWRAAPKEVAQSAKNPLGNTIEPKHQEPAEPEELESTRKTQEYWQDRL